MDNSIEAVQTEDQEDTNANRGDAVENGEESAAGDEEEAADSENGAEGDVDKEGVDENTPQDDNPPMDTSDQLDDAKEEGNTNDTKGTSMNGESEKKSKKFNSKLTSTKLKKRRSAKRRPRHYKLFQDAISVFIPIDVTADLKLAIQRTREKRIKSIYKRFPALAKEMKKSEDDQQTLDDEEDENKNKANKKDEMNDSNKSQKVKKKQSDHIPQPHQYGSVLDYLEAKYVKGVMLQDEDEDATTMDDKSEGQGSVYSGGSFLDDTDLQRDVAEQVMANTTMTKLELEEDDADFFVNVGNLEVEDNEYGDHYDPLQDKDSQTTKKRKKSQSSLLSSSTGTSQKKKKKTTESDSKTKKSSILSHPKTKKTSSPTVKTKENAEEKKRLMKIAKKAKSQSDVLYRQVVAMIKQMTEEELPRRRTKLKVALTCPANKKPGDDITFTNPHNPGQRLRVKVPKDCFPGGTFKVTVPVKQPPRDLDKDGSDHNKFSRMFQELLDDYARAYDDWCQAQAEADKKFAVYKEKQQKFDRLVKEFPSGLVTPVDANYLKKIVRRARQNKHKRSKTAAAKQGKHPMKGEAASDEEQENEDQDEESEEPQGRTVNIPTKGVEFTRMKWDSQDFAMDSATLGSGSAAADSQSSKTVRKGDEKKGKKKGKAKTEDKSSPVKKGRTVEIPTAGVKFQKIKWKLADFA